MPENRNPRGEGLEESFIKMALAQFQPMVDGLSRAFGPAQGALPYTEREQVDLATFSPYNDATERQKKIMELLQSGHNMEQVTDQIYPRLRKLIELSGTDVRTRIAYAKHLTEKISQHQQRQGVQPLQEPIAPDVLPYSYDSEVGQPQPLESQKPQPFGAQPEPAGSFDDIAKNLQQPNPPAPTN